MANVIYHRQSVRLKGYDYSQSGAYFVTICTKTRECLFGEIVDGKMRLNTAGQMARSVWEELPIHYPGINVDAFVVMPNHIHGIISIVGAQFIAPNTNDMCVINREGAINRAPTLGEIIRRFKAFSTYSIRRAHFEEFVWQRNYYERIIRNEKELQRIREYIVNNLLTWEQDENNPNSLTAIMHGVIVITCFFF